MARVPVLPQHCPQLHVVEIALVEHLAAQCPFVAHTAFSITRPLAGLSHSCIASTRWMRSAVKHSRSTAASASVISPPFQQERASE